MDAERSVAVAVKTLVNQFHRYMTSKKAEITAKVKGLEGLTEVHGRIIEYLYHNMGTETIYQKDLEKQFNIRRSTATVILHRMEKAGFVVREVSSEDGRMKALVLTDKAKKIYPKLHAEIVKAEAQARRGLSDEEFETFLRVTKKIVKNME